MASGRRAAKALGGSEVFKDLMKNADIGDAADAPVVDLDAPTVKPNDALTYTDDGGLVVDTSSTMSLDDALAQFDSIVGEPDVEIEVVQKPAGRREKVEKQPNVRPEYSDKPAVNKRNNEGFSTANADVIDRGVQSPNAPRNEEMNLRALNRKQAYRKGKVGENTPGGTTRIRDEHSNSQVNPDVVADDRMGMLFENLFNATPDRRARLQEWWRGLDNQNKERIGGLVANKYPAYGEVAEGGFSPMAREMMDVLNGTDPSPERMAAIDALNEHADTFTRGDYGQDIPDADPDALPPGDVTRSVPRDMRLTKEQFEGTPGSDRVYRDKNRQENFRVDAEEQVGLDDNGDVVVTGREVYKNGGMPNDVKRDIAYAEKSGKMRPRYQSDEAADRAARAGNQTAEQKYNETMQSLFDELDGQRQGSTGQRARINSDTLNDYYEPGLDDVFAPDDIDIASLRGEGAVAKRRGSRVPDPNTVGNRLDAVWGMMRKRDPNLETALTPWDAGIRNEEDFANLALSLAHRNPSKNLSDKLAAQSLADAAKSHWYEARELQGASDLPAVGNNPAPNKRMMPDRRVTKDTAKRDLESFPEKRGPANGQGPDNAKTEEEILQELMAEQAANEELMAQGTLPGSQQRGKLGEPKPESWLESAEDVLRGGKASRQAEFMGIDPNNMGIDEKVKLIKSLGWIKRPDGSFAPSKFSLLASLLGLGGDEETQPAMGE